MTAAETAADFAAIIYGDTAEEDEDLMQAWKRVEFERGAMVTAPAGSRIAQLKAEHPNATFDEFVKRFSGRLPAVWVCLQFWHWEMQANTTTQRSTGHPSVQSRHGSRSSHPNRA
jgi:hypothetical protein